MSMTYRIWVPKGKIIVAGEIDAATRILDECPLLTRIVWECDDVDVSQLERGVQS